MPGLDSDLEGGCCILLLPNIAVASVARSVGDGQSGRPGRAEVWRPHRRASSGHLILGLLLVSLKGSRINRREFERFSRWATGGYNH